MAIEDNALMARSTPPQVHFRHLRRAVEIGEKATARVKQFNEKHKEGVRRTTTALEFVGGAAAGGLIQGRMGDQKLFNTVPYDLAIGGVGVALGVFGGKYIGMAASEHALNLGAGVVAAWVSGETYKWGQKWRESHHLFGGSDAPATKAAGY